MGPSSERKGVDAWNVRLYYPYWQYTDLFIFRFVSLLCLCSTLLLFNYFHKVALFNLYVISLTMYVKHITFQHANNGWLFFFSSVTNRIISAKDHASVQINVGEVSWLIHFIVRILRLYWTSWWQNCCTTKWKIYHF